MSVKIFHDSTARWEYEKKIGCKPHDWLPVSLELARGGIAAEGSRVYFVCPKCGALSYMETWWPGYKLENSFDREEADAIEDVGDEADDYLHCDGSIS